MLLERMKDFKIQTKENQFVYSTRAYEFIIFWVDPKLSYIRKSLKEMKVF